MIIDNHPSHRRWVVKKKIAMHLPDLLDVYEDRCVSGGVAASGVGAELL